MKPNLDDPRLTAYALGELSEAGKARIEAILAESPEARQWVEEVQQTATQLATELAKEPCAMLEEDQLSKIESRLERGLALERELDRDREPKPPGTPWFPRLSLVTVLSALAITGVLAGLMLPALNRAKSRSMATSAKQELFVVRNSLISKPLSDSSYRMRSGEPMEAVPDDSEFNTESYAPITDNPFMRVLDHPLSTFSVDVDTASYAVVRRFINGGQLPPKDAVRIEEMINYFNYDYPQPEGEHPFSVNVEIASCPWNMAHRLMKVGLKGREISAAQRPQCNLVFLIDVSGSMEPENKLPLLKKALRLLVRELSIHDRVGIVVYAGSTGVVLEPTSDRKKVLHALDRLEAEGSTHGSAGLKLAYEVAAKTFIKGGSNRVILCTDGDFNVGVTSPGDLERLITDKARSGVFLSVLGFGMGNYKDSTVEMLADKGNGNYAYIDTLNEARKVLVEQMSGTLVTIAKDVKLQLEFNPAQAGAYRLIGYENRVLNKEDFNDDQKDAGEIGAGHTVTALYEIVPPGQDANTPGVDTLKYQTSPKPVPGAGSHELATIKLRYKEPEGDVSKLISIPVTDSGRSYSQASRDFKFASSVAAFGMVLRESPYKGNANFDGVIELAEEGIGTDEYGYRKEFLGLAKQASRLQGR